MLLRLCLWLAHCTHCSLKRVPCVQAAAEIPGGGGWSIGAGWDGARRWGERQWEEWRGQPAQWWESTKQTAGEWQEQPGRWWEASKEAAEEWRQRLSWQGLQEWQQRHWESFEARQKAWVEARKEQQQAKWEEWEERQRLHIARGQQRVRREIAAFEEW